MDNNKPNLRDRISNHWSENKERYYIGTIGVLSGVVATMVVMNKRAITAENVAMNDTTIGMAINSPVYNEAVVVPQGHPGYVVQNTNSGEVYMSQGQAARALGVSPSIISSHLNGKTAEVEGVVLERLGVAQYPQE